MLGLLAPAPVSASAPSVVTPASATVSSGELATIDIDALGLESSQLAAVIARIPALGGVPTSTLAGIVEGLPANSTLQDIVNAIKTHTGAEVTTGEVTQVLVGNAATNPAVLTSVLSDAASLLNGTPQGAKLDEVLASAISSLTPPELQQLETQLGTGGSPAELASSLTSKLANGELDGALSTILSELGAMTPTTATQAAASAGTTVGGLASELAIPQSALASASGTTAPLGSRPGFLTVLGSPSGLTMGVVPTAPAGTSTSAGGATTPSTTSAGGGSASTKLTRLRIVSHKVKGLRLILVVQVPAAGRLSVTATHLRHEAVKTARAKTVKLRIPLTKAGAADMRRRHKATIQVKVVFKPLGGSASAASTVVHFR